MVPPAMAHEQQHHERRMLSRGKLMRLPTFLQHMAIHRGRAIRLELSFTTRLQNGQRIGHEYIITNANTINAPLDARWSSGAPGRAPSLQNIELNIHDLRDHIATWPGTDTYIDAAMMVIDADARHSVLVLFDDQDGRLRRTPGINFGEDFMDASDVSYTDAHTYDGLVKARPGSDDFISHSALFDLGTSFLAFLKATFRHSFEWRGEHMLLKCWCTKLTCSKQVQGLLHLCHNVV